MENLISIIIPCYNDAQFIEQAVASALEQTYQPIEVIVVDDGSNEATKAVLRDLEPKITKLITQENRGQSAARNAGISEARGHYLLMLDSDDYFETTFCEKALEKFKNNPNTKLVTCYANLVTDNDEVSVYKPKGGDIQGFMFVNNALGTSMFKKDDWNECGGYDETMRQGFEDWEFFIRLLNKGGNALVIQEPLYTYRKRSDSTTARANSVKFKTLQYIYSKHSDLYKNNFESFVSNLLMKVEREEIEKVKNKNRIEYRIGHAILSPIRFIKKLFS